jgi:hypothetical protein
VFMGAIRETCGGESFTAVSVQSEFLVYNLHVAKTQFQRNTRVYPKVFGLTAWSKNCKWYSSLSLGAVASLFCESV